MAAQDIQDRIDELIFELASTQIQEKRIELREEIENLENPKGE